MEMELGGQGLVSYGGRRMAFLPGPGTAAAPVLAAQVLSSKPAGAAGFLGPGLGAGTYGYKIAYVVYEVEYAASPEPAIAVGAGIELAEILITLALPLGVTDLNVYGRTLPNTETLQAAVFVQAASGQFLLPATFLNQGPALDASNQKPVPANSVFRSGGGQLHRIHVPGTGVTGNVTSLDTNDPTAGASLGTIYGPTTPAAGAMVDLQAPVREGLVVQFAAAMVFAVTYS